MADKIDLEASKNEDLNKQKLSQYGRSFFLALALSALTTGGCKAQSFDELIGAWRMRQLWMDTTQMFDADDDRVALQRNIEQHKQRAPGAALPDTAEMMLRIRAEFEEFKRFTITINADSSFTRTGVDHRGLTDQPDSGRAVLEDDGWVLVDAGANGDRLPVVLTKEGLTFTGPGPRVIKMVFRKDVQ